jgi:hypothetical protein
MSSTIEERGSAGAVLPGSEQVSSPNEHEYTTIKKKKTLFRSFPQFLG